MRLSLLFTGMLVVYFASAQDANTLMKQADNFEKQLKDNDALNIYRKVLSADVNNMNLLIKCTELNCRLGEESTDKQTRTDFYNAAKTYADRAFAVDSNTSAANYAQALVYGKLIETDAESKKIVNDARLIYLYGTKALAIDPNHAKANYILGKWHYASVSLPWYKRVAAKAIYGKMPPANNDSAIFYLSKCISLDVYFTHAYLDLASAYEFANKLTQEIDILQKLLKLPNRASDDAAVKAQAQSMLLKLQ